MSSRLKVAERYAEALLQIAEERGEESRIVGDTALISTSLRESPEVHRRLCMPSVARHEKVALLRKAFGRHISEYTLNCMERMVDRGRTSLLSELDEAVQRVRNRREGVVEVEVRTARPVDKQQRALFAEKIAREFGPSSSIVYDCSPELIGGFQIISPERRIDCSVKAGLTTLRAALLEQKQTNVS